MAICFGQIFPFTGGEIVEADYFMSLLQEMVNQVAACKTCSAGDEDFGGEVGCCRCCHGCYGCYCWKKVTGFRLRVTGCWLQVTGCWLRVTGCRLRVAGYGLRVAGYGLLDTGPFAGVQKLLIDVR